LNTNRSLILLLIVWTWTRITEWYSEVL